MKENLVISSAPHTFNRLNVPQVMWGVVIALAPAIIASIILFKLLAVRLIATCIISCVATEVLSQKIRKKSIAINDGSAVVTGILLALVLPPSIPIWQASVGSVVAIGLGKQLFGGLGFNIFNPALLGRAFLMAAFPTFLTKWTNPLTLDAVTGATPLGLMKFEYIHTPYLDLFLGNIPGSLGETSALAILLGGTYLFIKRYAGWRIPFSFLLTAFLLSGVLHIMNPAAFPTPLFQILSGGMLLGAIFMATDPVTSPVTKKGRWIFGIGCGIFVIIIRTWSGLPEGVMYSILLMNSVTPLLNRFTRPRRFGT
ncbi:RnfABCDGE type electron transport complex subunit D [Omnitrophica bacterium]|nr:RnfABCDGE type electron transport complex subunit D [Candidatus Omnitrophota bacterium]